MNLFERRRGLLKSVGGLVKLIVTGVSGIVSFVTNVAMPTKITCEFSPVQSGTGDPSPSNVRSIIGYNELAVSGASSPPIDYESAEILSNTYISFTTGEETTNNYHDTTTYIPATTGNYFFAGMNGGNSSGEACVVYFYDSEKTYLGYKQSAIVGANRRWTMDVSIPSGTAFIRITLVKSANQNAQFGSLLIEPANCTKNVVTAVDADAVSFYNSAGTTTNSGTSVTLISADSIRVSGNSQYSSTKQLFSAYNLTIGKTYVVEADATLNNENSVGRIATRNSSNTLMKSSKIIVKSGHYSLVFTYDSNDNYLSFFTSFGASVNTDITFSNIKFYEASPFYGGTLTINEDGSGTLVSEWANIASYDGETLPGEWISDRDVYAPETTPTTGAQVIYKLATPTTYTLTASQVNSIIGTNNIWHDMNGGITVEYYNQQ